MSSERYRQRISEMEEQLAGLLSTPFMHFTEDNADAIPEAPGIYLIRENDKIVYSGSAQNLRLRLWQEHYLGEQVRMGGSQFSMHQGLIQTLIRWSTMTSYLK